MARQRAIESWPDGWYRTLMGDQMPPPVTAGDRSFQSRSATPRWRPVPRSAAEGTKQQQQQQLFVWPQGLWLVPLPQWDARAAACDGSEPELWWMCTNCEPVSSPSRPSACAISDELQQACQQYSSPRCRTG